MRVLETEERTYKNLDFDVKKKKNPLVTEITDYMYCFLILDLH